jgi:hypothetical protein
MTTLRVRAPACNRRNTPLNLPLLEYAERERVRALPRAARRIAQRLGVPAATALGIAQAAGFYCGDDK